MTRTAAINTIEDALWQCGVNDSTLVQTERDSLDRHGYILLPDVLDSDRLSWLRAAFESASSEGRHTADSRQSGTQHVTDLAWKGTSFQIAYTHPKLLAAVYHILGRPFRVFQLSGRNPLPGYGQQGLHTDWYPRAPSEPYSVVTALWLLDDFTRENGATRLIPGSHNFLRPLPKSSQQPESRHPDEKLVIGNAGSLLIFNGHLWHSGTRNKADQPRRVLQCQFAGRELIRPVDTLPDIAEQLAPSARYLLGV
ncbi:MAG TPA: phytanoyl-CoA dioxygenase family protein [Blastocatellia bacterium]|nr:phytanoyl-CoA dioxygenase family protein [Blastocatellia bacterium]